MTLKNSSRERLYYCYKSSYRIYPIPIAPSCKGSGIIYRYFPKDIPTEFDCGKQKTDVSPVMDRYGHPIGEAGYNIMFYKENFQNKTLLDRHIVSCRSSRQTIIGIAVPGRV